MYQPIGIISDTKVGGLESLLNYMTKNFFGKDDPAINEHHYHITKKTNTTKRNITFTMSVKVNLKRNHIIILVVLSLILKNN